MGKANHIHNAFITGEVTPRYYGRSDTNQYNNACEELRNFLVYPQGGITRRPGTIYKGQITKTDNTPPAQVRMFPFTASDGSSWQVVITEENVNNAGVGLGGVINNMAWKAIRTNDGIIEPVIPITYGFDPSTFDTDWPTALDWWDLGARGINLSEIQFCQAGDTLFFAHGSMRPFRILYNAAQVGVVHKIPPNTIPEKPAFMQIGYSDVRRTNTIALPNQDAARNIPFQNPNVSTVLRVTSAGADFYGNNQVGAGGPVSCRVTIDIVTPSLDGIFAFDSSYEGRQFKFSKDASSFGVFITKFISTTQCIGVAYSDGAFNNVILLPVVTNLAAGPTYGYGVGTADDSSWEAGFWNDVNGWPQTVCFFESRLVFGGNKSFPDTLWFSETNDVFQMDSRGFEQDPGFGTPRATDPFSQNSKEATVSSMRWMCPGKTIIAGTDQAEFVVEGPDQSKSIAITNTNSDPETHYGGARTQAMRFDNSTVFLQRDRKTLREMIFNLEENAYQAQSLNILAEHIASAYGLIREQEVYPGAALPGAIVSMVKQDSPFGLIWCLDNNGCLLGLTRDKNQQICAWHRHDLAGGEGPVTNGVGMAKAHGSVEYKPKILAISTVKGIAADADKITAEPDDLWMAVRRQIGTVGSNPADPTTSTWDEIVTIEVLAREWEKSTINRGWGRQPYVIAPILMDACIFWDGYDDVAGTVVAPAAYGKVNVPYASTGDQVTVIKDGYDLGEFTVDSQKMIDVTSTLSIDELAKNGEKNRWRLLVGYNFNARAIPITPEVQMATPGSSLGHTRRIDKLTIYFIRSLGVRFGIKASANSPIKGLEDVDFPLAANPADAQPLFTGEIPLNFSETYETRTQMVIESHRPLPCTIPYLISRLVVAED